MIRFSDVERWHRRLCTVTDQIIISGDLSEDPARAVEQIGEWQQAGISHVLDTRLEWSDEELVADYAPKIVYGWIGTDDDGAAKPDEWFDAGIAFATDALRNRESTLLVHCHMGINRGPSMAFRVLLESEWDPIEALDAIRDSRPIAGVVYAPDALGHYHRAHDVPADHRSNDRDRVTAWRSGYPTTGIRLTRRPD
ncbi:MAG: dual specificity protein phosphatase [Actinomycetota bacterium]|nr:dual specificity protein phosphatase [Actinomycetota bacterium]